MANVDRPNGLRPIGTISGSAWQGKVREYETTAATASAIGVGMAVIQEAAGNIEAATAADAALILGVVVGIIPSGNSDPEKFMTTGNIGVQTYPGYIPAATAGRVLVAVGEDILFAVQSSGTLVAASRGARINLGSNGIDTTTGRATGEITATAAQDASNQLQLHDYVRSPDNDVTLANSEWIVSINQYQNSHGSIGI